jgi:alcohol dehydrogenase class IV
MWFFRSPTVVFGEDALQHLREIKATKAFLVTDKFLNEKGITAPVQVQLSRAAIPFEIFDDIEPEPSLETIERGADAFDVSGADLIVAVGGGSVLDAAKAIWVLAENPDLELEQVSPLEPIKIRERARLVAIPTTAGTGSEVTWAFVVTMPGENGGPPRKLGSGHPSAVPDYALVDPVMSATMPAAITADTGMDALVQAIEGYIGNWSNDFSDGLCLVAAKLCFEWLERSYADPADREAIERMANAASIGGLGYINSMVGLAHSMGHALGASFKLPHGRLVGVCLPTALEFYAKTGDDERCADIVRFLGAEPPPGEPPGVTLAGMVRALAEKIEQPRTLDGAGITMADIDKAMPALIDHAMGDTVLFSSPRQPTEDELRRLFQCVHSGARADF